MIFTGQKWIFHHSSTRDMVKHVDRNCGEQDIQEFTDLAEFKSMAVMLDLKIKPKNRYAYFAMDKNNEPVGYLLIDIARNFKIHGVMLLK